MDEEIFKKVNPEIYFDLSKHSWFIKEFPTIDGFDYRIFDCSKKDVGSIKLKEKMKEDFILFQPNIYLWVYRILWIIFWLCAIYAAYRWSFIAAYFLFLMVLSGYIGIIARGEWEKKSLKISREGCEIDQTIQLKWDDISCFITIPYLLDNNSNDIVFAFIVSKTGILYNFNFGSFTFSSRQIHRKYLPVYVAYYRERSQYLVN